MRKRRPSPPPNRSPRLQVVLPRDAYEVYDKLAKLQRRSRSAVARDFLVELVPVISRVVATLEAAAQMDAQGRKKLVRALEGAQAQIETRAAQVSDLFTKATKS